MKNYLLISFMLISGPSLTMAQDHAMLCLHDTSRKAAREFAYVMGADDNAINSPGLLMRGTELESFNAVALGHMVSLEWTTNSEYNTDHYSIEKSRDGKSYELLAKVKGLGKSDTRTLYNYTDQSPYQGTSWYRLSQNYMDGHVELFKPVMVKFASAGERLVFPDPGNGKYVEVRSGNQYKITGIMVLNSVGQEVISITVKHPSTSVFIDLSGKEISTLTPGFYQISIKTKEDTYYESLVITD
jgi:hypothetical protein